MPEATYVASALGVAVLITVSLRSAPFLLRGLVGRSAAFADLGPWMPLGAVTVLAIYCLRSIDVTAASHGMPQIAGLAATAGVHRWRTHAVLSIVTGTAACVLLANSPLVG